MALTVDSIDSAREVGADHCPAALNGRANIMTWSVCTTWSLLPT